MAKFSVTFSGTYNKSLTKLHAGGEWPSRIRARIKLICNNPEHFKPLRNVYKGMRRAHVGDKYVIIYDYDKRGKKIIFHKIEHRDNVYTGKRSQR